MNELLNNRTIVVEELRKRFDGSDRDAVAGVSFEVGRGEVYGLLGPNGSGKSTTLGILVTLLRPTAGRVTVLGHDVTRHPDAVRRGIGVALQETGVDPAETGRRLLELHARLLGRDRRAATARAAALLEAVDLSDAADRTIRTYSGGMRRRLDLALALVGDPALVCLDEPTTGLDPASRQALWAQVEALRDGGTTVLLTTQYLEEADRLADRVGILAEGELRAEGRPAELKRRIGGDVLTLEVEPAVAPRAAALVSGRDDGDGRVRVEVEDGGAAVPRALAVLGDAGIVAATVAIARPTLDDVYFAVTGARLRPEDASEPTVAGQVAA